MRREVFDPVDKVLLTVGETPRLPVATARELTDEHAGALNMVFQFEHVNIDYRDGSKWSPAPFDVRALKASMARWQDGLRDAGWNSLYFNNHDQPRVVSRWGDDDRYRVESAKALATLLHLPRGTPDVFQGEEIGRTTADLAGFADLLDIQSRNYFLSRPGTDAAALMAAIRPLARDNARGPVHWDAGPQAGFTSGTPWMAVHTNHTTINVAADRADPDSVLGHYRALIALRHSSDLIAHGACVVEALDNPSLYVLTRSLSHHRAVMVANLSGDPVPAGADVPRPPGLSLTLSNYAGSPALLAELTTLRPWEALVYTSEEV